jgi:hypothetical protein
MTDIIEVAGGIQIVEVIEGGIEIVEVGIQGPPGPQGNHGFTTSVDVISGGKATTDYTTGFIFSGGSV